MKAIICTKYGSPDVLQMKEIEKPIPKDNEILVKIYSTTVSVADCRVRSFNVPISFWIPARLILGIGKPKRDILGTELSGKIEAVGKDVKQFKKGDDVCVYPGHEGGAYAEYISIAEDKMVVVKPSNLGYEEASAIFFGGLTALYFFSKAEIKSGDKVLIYGASGSVGTSAVQLAKNYYGAEVTGVCSTKNIDLVKSIGADYVIDYTKEDFTKNEQAYNVIFDTVGKSSLSASMKALKKGGVFLHSVATPGTSLKMWLTSIKTGKKLLGGDTMPTKEDLVLLKELVEQNKFKPVIDKVYPMEQIVEAHRYVDKGHKKGNVVINIVHNKEWLG